MISRPEITNYIARYALILAIMYLFELVVQYSSSYLIPYIAEYIGGDNSAFTWGRLGSVVLSVVLNIITAVLVSKDIKKLELQTRYLILLTLLWRPLGVCLLLITLINNLATGKEQSADNKAPLG